MFVSRNRQGVDCRPCFMYIKSSVEIFQCTCKFVTHYRMNAIRRSRRVPVCNQSINQSINYLLRNNNTILETVSRTARLLAALQESLTAALKPT